MIAIQYLDLGMISPSKFALDLGTEEYYEVPEGDTSFKVKKCESDCSHFEYMNAVLGECLCVSRDHLSSGGSYKSMGDETIWSERVVDGVTLSVSRSMADQYISHHCCWNRIFLDDGGGCQPWFNLGNETGETLRITALLLFSMFLFSNYVSTF
ncbi:hypothetical protein ES332_D03G070800v1 [Gossypium tomentosum]|uniref:Uncharacterized protein n=1 Tax=Gossypium tomentosum TaxID=34277 RepID=A0A5D2LLS4_GOSTO|nr:hypothetical protein ES332_D03G070800v1 [Gossypium tomentosum]